MSAGAVALAPIGPANRWLRFAAALLGLLALGVLAVGLLSRGAATGPESGPTAADAGQLHALSGSLGHAVYWAGAPSPATQLELTHTTDGSVYVRYLDAGTKVGDARRGFTTVGTYPVPTAFAVLSREAQRSSSITRSLPGGGIAVMNLGRPQSVYLAWPGSGYEVEVFDPSPKRALDLVLSGAIAPVD